MDELTIEELEQILEACGINSQRLTDYSILIESAETDGDNVVRIGHTVGIDDVRAYLRQG